MGDVLVGVKTYIVSAGIVLTGVGAFFHGDTNLLGAITLILNGLGLASLRLAVGTKS